MAKKWPSDQVISDCCQLSFVRSRGTRCSTTNARSSILLVPDLGVYRIFPYEDSRSKASGLRCDAPNPKIRTTESFFAFCAEQTIKRQEKQKGFGFEFRINIRKIMKAGTLTARRRHDRHKEFRCATHLLASSFSTSLLGEKRAFQLKAEGERERDSYAHMHRTCTGTMPCSRLARAQLHRLCNWCRIRLSWTRSIFRTAAIVLLLLKFEIVMRTMSCSWQV